MVNLTDGKSDGIGLVYIKNGKAYPIGVATAEYEMLDALFGSIVTSITVVEDHPIGEVIPLAQLKK